MATVESYKRRVREDENDANQKTIEALTRPNGVFFRKRSFAFSQRFKDICRAVKAPM